MQIEAQAAGQRQQLAELETAIVDAEAIIPEDVRERYRRTVKQHGAEAMAPVEYDRKARSPPAPGCFVSVTTQALNELINGTHELLQDLRPGALPGRGRLSEYPACMTATRFLDRQRRTACDLR